MHVQAGCIHFVAALDKIALKKFNKDIDEEVKNPSLVNPVEPIKPKGSRYKVEKATVNGLLNTLEVVPFAGLFSSDAGEFFSSHSFQDSNKAIEMVSTLSKAWSGEDLERNTGIELNNIKLHDRRFNMLVMLQQELAGFLNNSQYKDQGFTNRMLISQCQLFTKAKMQVGNTKLLKHNMASLEPFNDRVYDLLEKVNDAQTQARNTPLTLPGQKSDIWKKLQQRAQLNKTTNPNELILPLMEFDIENDLPFEQFLVDYYNDLVDRQTDPKYAEYSNFMSRAFEHFCRIAATLAAFNLDDKISRKMADCAQGITEYFIEQRLNLTIDGAQKVNPIVECADKFYKWLVKQPNKESSKEKMQQYGPKQYREMDTAQRALVISELESRDKIEIVEVSGTGTKSKHIVRVL